MYESRLSWVQSGAFKAADAAERAYWRRVGLGQAEPARVRGNARDYAPELERIAPTWGRCAWEKQAAQIEAAGGNDVPALPFDASDDDIRVAARAIASGLYGRALEHAKTLEGARKAGEDECRAWGVALPVAKDDRGALARLFESDWWVRRLRAAHGRRIEGAAQSAGYVHKGAACYVSDVSLARRQDQKARNRAAMERQTIVNQFGDEFTLAELAEKSNANPRVRAAELLTRIRGFELIAGDLGHVAEFWTMTAPSRMHAVKADGKLNPKWDGTKPREAQAWLCQQWARFRAWAGREGVEYYGFRVAEPHHDGCPHWHLLLFMAPADAAKARARFHRCAMVTPESEALRNLTKKQIRAAHPGMTWAAAAEAVAANHARALRIEDADEDRKVHATKFVQIDPNEPGGAVGYIIKYISKNVDGYKLDRDLFGNDAVSASQRVEAWSSTWGIRQFQQVGGAPVGVWRELRRLKADDVMTATISAAREAADVGKNSGYGEAGAGWAEYLRIQGGATVKRKELALVAARTEEGEKFDPVERVRVAGQQNCYGEPCAKSVFGVRDVRRDAVAFSRRFKWEVKRGGESVRRVRVAGRVAVEGRRAVVAGRAGAVVGSGEGEARSAAPSSSGLSKGEARAAWTRVNNCTEGGMNGRTENGRDGGESSRNAGGRCAGEPAGAPEAGSGGAPGGAERGAQGHRAGAI